VFVPTFSAVAGTVNVYVAFTPRHGRTARLRSSRWCPGCTKTPWPPPLTPNGCSAISRCF